MAESSLAMEPLSTEHLLTLLGDCMPGTAAECIIKELIASRPIVGAAIERHEAQFAHDMGAYLRANDLLLEVCDTYQQAQRF